MSNYYNRQWRLPNNENKDKQSNYSMDFDGTQIVTQGVGNFTSFNGVSECSVSLWFKSSTSQGPYKWFFNVPATTTGNHGFGIYGAGTGLKFHSYTSTSSPNLTEVNINFGGNQWDGNWHHLVLTYKNGVGLRGYYDGVLQFTNTSATGTITAGGEELAIGGFSTSYSTGRIIAQIDGVSAFTYALSASQVTTLYGSSSTGIGNPMSLSPAPVAYYPLGDQDVFNGSNYLVPNSSLKDYVFDFDGSSYIDAGTGLGDSLGGSYSGDLTVSMWLKFNSTSTQYGLFYIGNLAGGSGSFWINTSASKLWIYANNGSAGYINCSISSLNTTDWYNVICVYKGYDISNSKIYINNVSQTLTTSGNFNYTYDFTSKKTAIGDYYTTPPFRGFNGEISNTQIFNTALSSTDVETLYNNGSPLTSMSGFTSLVGWWKLDATATYDSSTTTWTIPDDSTNSNTGTSSGMTQANLVQSDLSFTSGYSPFALYFDGANDYIDSNNVPSQLNTVTASVWVKRNGSQPSSAGVFGIRNTTGGSTYGVCWDIAFLTTTNKIEFRIGDTTYHTVTQDSIMPDNTWTHVVGVADGANIFLYINGVKQVDTDTYTTPIETPTNEISFGRQGTAANYFKGSLSNACYFNTGLSQSEITELYSEGVPSNLNNHSAYSNLVSWWQLGSNSSFNTNWTVLDEKGSNNGTSVNMGEDAIVDGVGSYANGVSSGMSDNIVGSAPFSDANSLSYNMDILDRTDDTPS